MITEGNMNITELPTEIIQLIMGYSETLSDFAALACACHSFADAADDCRATVFESVVRFVFTHNNVHTSD
jgi:hypothetical protein